MSEKDNEFAALDKMLAQMAEETPDVPDDFHARWTEAVKAEANQNKAETRKAGNRQWRYILSAAAVFAFLIGGTLLTRNDPFFERTNRGGTTAKTQVSETAGAVSAPSGMLMTEERETEESAEVYGTEPEMVFSMKTAADRDEAGNGTGNGIADYSAAAGGATEAAMEEAGPEAPMLMDAAMEEAQPEAPMLMDAAEAPEQEEAFVGEEEAAAPEEKTAATAMPTAMPTATPAATATAMPTAAPTATEIPAGVPAEEKQASFLQDLGIFTLKTLAALAACAAAAFLAALISREIKKKKEGKKNHDV